MIYSRIRILRKKRNWTQKKLADRLKLPRATIIAVEQHKGTSLENALLLAREFRQPIGDVFSLKPFDEEQHK